MGRKDLIADVFGRLGLSRAGLKLQRSLLHPFVRAINYHDVPPSEASAFDRQLDLFARHFDCVDYEGLLGLQRGAWDSERPGLIITFDDGLRSHRDVVVPRLEARGWVGWFMVPTLFVDTPPAQQRAYAAAHQIDESGHDWGDPRIALDWDGVRHIAEHHVLGCHSHTHRRLGAALSPAEFDLEIPKSKARMEQQVGREVPVFAWVGGEEPSYSRAGAEAIAAAGFRVSFMTNNAPIRPGADLLQLQRTNIEARNPHELVRLQLSGVMDLAYTGKRARVNALTRVDRPAP